MVLKKQDNDRYIFSASEQHEPISWRWSLLFGFVLFALSFILS